MIHKVVKGEEYPHANLKIVAYCPIYNLEERNGYRAQMNHG